MGGRRCAPLARDPETGELKPPPPGSVVADALVEAGARGGASDQELVLNFPPSPTDGDQWEEGGRLYQFDASINGAWRLIGTGRERPRTQRGQRWPSG